jgi:LemA protein
VERRNFNEAVQSYNTAVKRFPAMLFAGALGFPTKPYFQSTPDAATPPKVQFDFGKPATNK